MTVALARILAALCLEHDNLVALNKRVNNFTYYLCTLYGRCAYLHCTVSIYEQYLVKFNSLAFLNILDVVNEELLAFLGLKLLTLNVYNYVHFCLFRVFSARRCTFVHTSFCPYGLNSGCKDTTFY